jgi:GNAT superfamily N-acetyltransferase
MQSCCFITDRVFRYEIQVRSEYQRQGLGSWLLKIIELGIQADKRHGKGPFCLCEKIMLTCHLANKDGLAFYRAKGFVEDPSCPSFWNSAKEARRIGYTILYKAICK